ncbi:MAG TPA: hypothetical protein DEP72_02205 [Clostridiales bacterium]|nr:MAG: hypothetical protein A2Y18_00395 [Clostridiales bacterium GWD2_32_19]HCC06969.1 hypothetical protein [Clostridiales bacterium]
MRKLQEIGLCILMGLTATYSYISANVIPKNVSPIQDVLKGKGAPPMIDLDEIITTDEELKEILENENEDEYEMYKRDQELKEIIEELYGKGSIEMEYYERTTPETDGPIMDDNGNTITM